MITISSKSWRIRTSEIAEIELAQSLTALRKCIGGISPNTEDVRFGNGSANYKGEQIQIDTEFASKAGMFPIPSENFDVLVGLAVHEAAHTRVESAKLRTPTSVHEQIFSERDFRETAEEVYTDQYVARNYPVQYRYLGKARDAFNKPVVVDWSKPNQVWILEAVYGNPRDLGQIPKWQRAIHTLLDALVTDLTKKNMDYMDRNWLYNEYWDAILKLLQVEQTKADLGKGKTTVHQPAINLPPELAKDFTADARDLEVPAPELQDEDQEVEGDTEGQKGPHDLEGEEPDSGEETQPQDQASDTEPVPTPSARSFPEAKNKDLTALPQHIQEAVENALESATEDLTHEVVQAMVESGQLNNLEKVPSIYSNSTSKTPAPEPSPKVVRDLEWVSRIKNTIRTQTTRGEPEGILDRKRLYRHYTDGKPYKVHRTTPRQDLDLVLLVDGSYSMRGEPELIYETCYALLKVIPEARLLVYSYLAKGCHVVSYNHTKPTKKVEVGGGTPTGRAMIMTAHKYPRSLIIHYSDGEFNKDIAPKQAMENIIAKRWPKVQMANIILNNGGESYSSFSHDKKKEWPAKGVNYTTEFIKELGDFPEALRKALKPWYQV